MYGPIFVEVRKAPILPVRRRRVKAPPMGFHTIIKRVVASATCLFSPRLWIAIMSLSWCTGCVEPLGLLMAADAISKAPAKKDLTLLTQGTPRARIHREFGASSGHLQGSGYRRSA